MTSRKITLLCLGLYLLPLTVCHAAENKKLRYEDETVFMRLVLRTPEQLTAFYQGREFPPQAIEKILATCFVTPIIKNKSYEVLWLELDDWQFIDHNGRAISRLKRDYWRDQWQSIQLKQAYRSTFGWTLMPEVRDLRLDEGVGGSVVIPWQTRPFTLVARFKTGKNKKGSVKTIRFAGVKCRTNL